MKQRHSVALALAAIGTALTMTSCCNISDEQLAKIRQLRAEEKQLTADIQKAETDRSKIQNELSSRLGEVRKCNERLSFVQDKKSKWPNVWQNWDPTVPVEEPAAPTPKKKK
jgi:outer membrane murein-binding lipoprotein Lpp